MLQSFAERKHIVTMMDAEHALNAANTSRGS